ncbi:MULTISPECIES: hypothetical protein [unclassified Amycolatopsis]|uniref:hypothetical protein n=1 Tax=unclassified Amycolatopsis TaxID=2618356 RepID=UPI001C694966|nr:hypothetical protein [Amycolatopsis sp. DSM 110486]QYN20815.1 hypothetical protein K1T34_51605 [Amycolatopsis sp. DSM 110486]
MTQTERRPAYDFDFFTGTWQVRHRRLSSPLDSTSDWIEFEGITNAHTHHGGAIHVDEVSLAEPGHYGFTIRTYDQERKDWTIHWVNNRVGRLEPPVRGRFTDGVGTFYGTDEVDGRPVRVRFVWSEISDTTARWRQAFSVDGGTTWVDNWEMRFTREAK